MLSRSVLTTLTTALCAYLSVGPAAPVAAAPVSHALAPRQASGSFWMGDIQRQGAVAFGSDYGVGSDYQVFRNVKDFGAKGDGSSDDTQALLSAINAGNRCGQGCDSTTVTPAIVYFPPGTYVVSKPIQMKYYTQLIGDANTLPTIKATASFQGMAVLDADPYENDGSNWFTNQNNFFRQVRNFVIDITEWKDGSGNPIGAGVHWQVAQATSLQNIVFEMSEQGVSAGTNAQQGIFMDNGSGGFMSDLTFNNGNIGAFLGSQQFTSRNMTFNNCRTAIFMNWNWGWTFNGITVNGAVTGLNMSNSPQNQTVGSVVLSDSKIQAQYGVATSFKTDNNVPANGGQLVIDNVDFSGTQNVVVDIGGSNLPNAPSSGHVDKWIAGVGYTGPQSNKVTNSVSPGARPADLLNNGAIHTVSKPQYADLPSSSFLSAKSNGCKGDGTTDDTQAVQNLLNTAASSGKVAYFDHGAYRLTDTVTVPVNSKIVGEIWPLIVADGFKDVNNPKAVFQVGKADGSSSGSVQIQDLIFETLGPQPGAVMVEWNLQSQQSDETGMWDSHVRLGGSAGTELQWSDCAKDPTSDQSTKDLSKCEAAFLMFHATSKSSGVYLENTWFWVADHELDESAKPSQISLYNGRGALFESSGPVWLWGTASEHSVIYNYQFNHVTSLFSGFMQSETPYMQPNPEVPQPFKFNPRYDDPTFTICQNQTGSGSSVPCKDAWGLRIYNSENILLYGTGLYSFFNNYEQECVAGQNCQQHMIHIQASTNVQMYAVSTKAAVNMLDDDTTGAAIKDADNRSNFCATIAYYWQKATS
ncbi:glycoside hydrolase family 55 protein [Polychaeton citri CBS 116435]|uniref:Glycoside hydrolase family 55 protein n=1 Tax=Polychaeton citri CBS 116435 TaxID=1314669 RepID=A0A9P4QF03_9PEZI|nr:glycoside hydrolase family 55 protein [Polychaeton citri CBS 116435]